MYSVYSFSFSISFPLSFSSIHFVSKVNDTRKRKTKEKEKNSLYAQANERSCALFVHVRTISAAAAATHLFGILVKGKQNQNHNMLQRSWRKKEQQNAFTAARSESKYNIDSGLVSTIFFSSFLSFFCGCIESIEKTY